MGYVSVIVPMGLFNILGSLQNIESAEAAGDRYDARSSLAANGLGTIAAACFGSCFPTTIYIGHPGWKEMGARAGYSTLNGLVITVLCLGGMVGLLNSIIPIDAGIAIVLWIGIVITAQAFQVTPHEHAPAVAMGLFPAIAAWGATIVGGAFLVAGLPPAAGASTMEDILRGNTAAELNGFLLNGLLLMERGFIFTCMLLAAISALLIDRRFVAAGVWSLAAAAFAAVGLTHAYQLQGNVVDYLFVFADPDKGAYAFRAHGIAIGYVLFALTFFAMAAAKSRIGQTESEVAM
jgi:AGZA family xanthine/uracil permease-like MFS transporter